MHFFQKVYELVSKIPKGKVTTYGQVASFISSPRAARIVGVALRELPRETRIPWHRVVNFQGMISIENLSLAKHDQANRLQKERVAVEFRNGNYWVNLKKYLWKNFR